MWPTIIVAAIVAGIFIAIIASSIRSRRQGNSGCSSGGCSGCGASAFCHGQIPDKKSKA